MGFCSSNDLTSCLFWCRKPPPSALQLSLRMPLTLTLLPVSRAESPAAQSTGFQPCVCSSRSILRAEGPLANALTPLAVSFHQTALVIPGERPLADLQSAINWENLFQGLKPLALCSRAFSPALSLNALLTSIFAISHRAESPAAQSTGFQPCVCSSRSILRAEGPLAKALFPLAVSSHQTAPVIPGERLLADLQPATKLDHFFQGLNPLALCSRAFSPVFN